MIGCSHGNTDANYVNIHHNKAFNKCFVFGEKEKQPHTILGGIPSNDKLKKYSSEEKKHILVICHCLGPSETFEYLLTNIFLMNVVY